ncbi:MAG: hypothetical protein ACI4JZ_01600 [Oscillospiraceae bacterium]
MKWRFSAMTAQSSVNLQNKPFYKFLPYFLNKLRFLRPQMIMTGIFALLSYPLVGFFVNMWVDADIRVSELNKSGDILTPELQNAMSAANVASSLVAMSIVIGGICLVGMFVFTFVTTLRSFRYLYNKNAVDMDYALPVNHNTPFFADLAAVFTTSIIPHFISVIIGVIFTNVIADKAKIYLSNGNFQIIEMISSIVLQCMFVGLFACFMQIAFSLLMISTSGKKAVAAVFPVLINIAIPIIHALSLYIIESNTFGSTTIGETLYYPVCATSPVGMITITAVEAINFLFGVDYGVANTNNVTLPIFRAEYLITAIVLTIIFFVGAYFLIKLRRNERVGNAYVYKGMSVIIPGIVVLAMSLPMWNMVFEPFSKNNIFNNSYTPNSAAWILGLLISTFIVYVILELISGKAFRRFHITVAKWAGSVVGCAGIAALLVFSNGFGKAEFVPAPENVVSANVWIWSNNEKNTYNNEFGIDGTTDKDTITEITELHKKVPKRQTEDYSDYRITLDYLLTSGEVISRRYWISPELYSELMNQIVTPKNWYERKCGDVEQTLKEQGSEVVQISVSEIEYVDDDAYNSPNKVYLKPSEFDVNRFLEAIRKDSEKMNFELYWNSKNNYSCAVEIIVKNDINHHLNIYIEDWMENTIDYLNNFANATQN